MTNSIYPKINLYQPKEIVIKTTPQTTKDLGMPFDATKLEVIEHKENGDKKIWANYFLSDNPKRDLENLQEILASIYAQDNYKPSTGEN